jgi:hypothetical protein
MFSLQSFRISHKISQNRHPTQPLQQLQSVRQSFREQPSYIADEHERRNEYKYYGKYQHSTLDNALMVGLIRFPVNLA